MKNFILCLIAVVFTLGLGVGDVEAKRFGGGSSLGMQRQVTPPQAPRPSAAPAPQAPQGAATTPPRRSWMGPLAGLAAGLGVAALFSHLGLGEELGSLLMIGLLVFAAVALFRLLSRRSTGTSGAGGMQYAGATPTRAADASPPATAFGGGSAAAATPAIPPDFDADAFARQAKVNFIRLQAAHDAGNLDDIREFTSPEMYAEIRLQMADRGMSAQRTDVVELSAQVLEVAEEAQRYIVSVRFTGLLREEPNAAPAPFDEIWHLTKPRSGGTGWVVAGIQQVA
ncbi:Tim44 domain-containing protein [Aromatoleum toluvorans]|uniref:Tim44 domain-containing protein n=1 Tax=Aromatoleum toluvorans TaxID=92002 RepID=A0ABX1PTK6_9RHOO|nr:Tim44-like domain-containing protein [Aromatoleum toluvorans]NMG42550.1 Tim44 domain-containing protein [Aromatoleum toluvorans]